MIKKFENFITEGNFGRNPSYLTPNLISKLWIFWLIQRNKNGEDGAKPLTYESGDWSFGVSPGLIEDTVELYVKDGTLHCEVSGKDFCSSINGFSGYLDQIFVYTEGGSIKASVEFDGNVEDGFEEDGIYSTGIENILNMEDFERYLDNYISKNVEYIKDYNKA